VRWHGNLNGYEKVKTEFFKLISAIWSKSAAVEIAHNGFCATALFPANQHTHTHITALLTTHYALIFYVVLMCDIIIKWLTICSCVFARWSKNLVKIFYLYTCV